jgi:hypothetical protein
VLARCPGGYSGVLASVNRSQLAWREYGRGRVGEAGEVVISGDEVVGAGCACERDEVVVVGVG